MTLRKVVAIALKLYSVFLLIQYLMQMSSLLIYYLFDQNQIADPGNLASGQNIIFAVVLVLLILLFILSDKIAVLVVRNDFEIGQNCFTDFNIADIAIVISGLFIAASGFTRFSYYIVQFFMELKILEETALLKWEWYASPIFKKVIPSLMESLVKTAIGVLLALKHEYVTRIIYKRENQGWVERSDTQQ